MTNDSPPRPQIQTEIDAMIQRQDNEEKRAMSEWNDIHNSTIDDIRDALRSACAKAGGVTPWCNQHRVWPGVVIPFLAGEEPPHNSILGPLGYQSRVSYVRVKA